MYNNNRSVSFTHNGTLHIKPAFTADSMDLGSADLSLWGGDPASAAWRESVSGEMRRGLLLSCARCCHIGATVGCGVATLVARAHYTVDVVVGAALGALIGHAASSLALPCGL